MMNCERYREKWGYALARGEGVPNGDLAVHIRDCAACRVFCETQVQLFAAIDAGVKTMANEVMPASLMPGVRVKMEGGPRTGSWWRVSWVTAAVVTVAFTIALVGIHRGNERITESPRFACVTPETAKASGVVQNRTREPRHEGGRSRHIGKTPSQPEHMPKVIILAEEREAFVKFVAAVPENQELAIGLMHPVPKQELVPVDIALLKIEQLQLPPLAASEEE